MDFPSIFEKMCEVSKDAFYFSNPNDTFAFIAYDRLITNSIDIAFPILGYKKWDSSDCILYNSIPHKDLKLPLFIGSQKFAEDKKESIWMDFPYQEWFIPKVILLNQNESYHLIVNFLPGDCDLSFIEELENICSEKSNAKNKIIIPESFETKDDSAEWISNVYNFLDEIIKRRIEKAVLARRVISKLNHFSYSYALQELESKYPECITFAYKIINSVFFGATPEKLFTINNCKLYTEAVAGSSPRGNDPNEDLLLEQKLLNDAKELNEHQNVVDFIMDNLTGLVKNQVSDDKPGIKKLKNIQHIRTSISADVKKGINILDIVKSLHPTPAVCGFPQKEAFEIIDVAEKFDRGLYSGVIGWFDERQNGEFVVGIRSALVTGNKLYAYAGCGIVEGSDPVSEYRETELKLKPILSLLNNETTG